jgi:hypothetical protein
MATPMWQEVSGVGFLQRLGSERASSKLDLAPVVCICAPPELGLISLGPEVAFFRPKVSSSSKSADACLSLHLFKSK